MEKDEGYVLLKRRALERYFGRMNDMQKRAVFHVEGPLLILAGAGSGKTTVLISRIENMVRFGDAYHSEAVPPGAGEREIPLLRSYLAGEDVPPQELAASLGAMPVKPWNILAITFTNKAAGELKTRLADTLGETAPDVHASTFHSLCVRILRREIEHLGYSSGFTIYDADDSQRLIREAVRAVQLDEKLFPPRSVLSAISRAKDSLESPQDMREAAGDDYRAGSVAKIYDYYQKQLRAANALDFDDIIRLTVRLFQESPQVLEKYRERYRYIMVDEYQDTNHAQYMLIGLLAAKYRNLCVVGDDDQSIYKFRGATIENILGFERQFPGAQVIRLEENYRSTRNILGAANTVIANNKARKGKTLWTSAGEGDKVEIHQLRDEEEESRFIADTVLEHVRGGGKFSECAVLYRINAQSNSVEKALAKNAIPYRIVGGLRFYERKEIKDIVAYLSVLENPGDTLRLLRVINEPKRGIGASTVDSARQIADALGCSVYDVLREAESYPALTRKAKELIAFAGLIGELARAAAELSLSALLDLLLDKTGYLRMLQAQGFEGAGRLENIMELKSNLVRYGQQNDAPTLAGFLEEISLYTDLDSYDQNEEGVTLMTVHSAKGLEFPIVFIAGMEEGVFPGKNAIFSGRESEIEEERRLAYVAITRAKRRLLILSAQRRMLFGQTVYSQPSRFVGEIPKEHAQSHEREVPRPAAVVQSPPRRRDSAYSIGVGGQQKPAPGAGIDLVVGDTVSHKVFGEGEVLSVKPMGGDLLVEIRFDKAGLKKVMANFARLTKL